MKNLFHALSERRIIPLTEPTLTPLCDAALTLIVVFIIMMPGMFWSGIKVNATRAVRDNNNNLAVAAKSPQFVSLSITKKGVYLNGKLVDSDKLVDRLRESLAVLEEKTVIVLPDADVPVQAVVSAFDSAKLAGAKKLALLKKA